MGLNRSYRLKCDNCGLIHVHGSGQGYSSARGARAAAHCDGWQRRKVMTGQYRREEWLEDERGNYYRTGRWMMCPDYAWRDFCPACLDRMERENG